MKKPLIALMTNDVETTSLVNNRLDDRTGEKVMNEGMPAMLDLYEKHGVKSTFFFTGYIAEKYPDIVRMILGKGHEVASHGYSHKEDNAFDVMSYEKQVEHLKKAKGILESIAGGKVISFRAPALRVNRDTPKALLETGFEIDSSISPQRFDMFMSFGSLKKLNWIFAPRLPYFTKADDLSRRGASSILEIPISALGLPYIGTTMRIFPSMTRVIGKLLAKESQINGKPINFLIHPNELIIEDRDSTPLRVRSKNLLKRLLADKLRYRLKLNNLGEEAVKLYEKEIISLKSRGFEFITLSDYKKILLKEKNG